MATKVLIMGSKHVPNVSKNELMCIPLNFRKLKLSLFHTNDESKAIPSAIKLQN